MTRELRRRFVLAAVILAGATDATAQYLDIQVGNGQITIVADHVPAREILAEWARVGDIALVSGEKLAGPPLTLFLKSVPESGALEMLLKDVGGYVVSMRTSQQTGNASVLRKIIVLPKSDIARAEPSSARAGDARVTAATPADMSADPGAEFPDGSAAAPAQSARRYTSDSTSRLQITSNAPRPGNDSGVSGRSASLQPSESHVASPGTARPTGADESVASDATNPPALDESGRSLRLGNAARSSIEAVNDESARTAPPRQGPDMVPDNAPNGTARAAVIDLAAPPVWGEPPRLPETYVPGALPEGPSTVVDLAAPLMWGEAPRLPPGPVPPTAGPRPPR
jgi:hypothetical protein